MHRYDAWALRAVSLESQSLEETPAAKVVLALYDTERIPLTRYLFFLGMDADTSRDLVHDAFLKLHEHVTGAGDRSQLRAWLYRVAHNLAQNRRRGLGGSRLQSLQASEAHQIATSDDPSPEDLVLGRERDAMLERAMHLLTPTRRECLLLRAQGFRYREIADITGTSTSTVAENVQKGIEQIKHELTKGSTGV